MTSTSKILALVASFAILVHASPLPPPVELPIYERTIFTNISDTFDWKDVGGAAVYSYMNRSEV